MRVWGGRIDNKYFLGSNVEKITHFNLACSVLLEQLKICAHHHTVFRKNTLIVRAQSNDNISLFSRLCHCLANPASQPHIANTFDEADGELSDIESRLDDFLGDDYLQTYSTRELAEFYLFVNLQASILAAIVQCRSTLEELDWNQLREKKF